MVKWEQKIIGDLLLLLHGVLLAVVLNQLASLYFFRLDLTEERRYSIKQPTRDLLQHLDEEVYVDVFLEGDLNAEFRRLQKAIRETLDEFRVYSGNKVTYRFSDPAAAKGQQAQREFMSDLVSRGIKPMNIIDTRDGQRTERIVFPGAVVSAGGMQVGVMLLKDQIAQGSQEDLNRAVEGVEFELANAILQVTGTSRKRVGFVSGHGELDSMQVASFRESLMALYDVNLKTPLTKKNVSAMDVLIIARPRLRFSEQEKYVLDQYVMRGGKLLMLLDPVSASMDSVSSDNYIALPYRLGLENLLFQYGVRVNEDLVQDRVSLRYPVVTGEVSGKPQVTAMDWLYYPLINSYAATPITRNLDATALRFASSIDSVKATGIRKTPLLFSSSYARRVNAPVRININDLRKEINPENFSSGPFALGYLLEGKFVSLFRNRFAPENADTTGNRKQGVYTRMIVVADGDLARNEINRRTGQPVDLGFDSMNGHTYANKDLLLNMIAYLVDEAGLISARTREVKVRPLDKEKIRNSRVQWQVTNLVLPVLLVLLLGGVKYYTRKRKFGQITTVPHG
ncbi:MAG: gliding motility-associated ABC transporter substrate-binding protein GldG [Cytophagales bacterium]|nr:gliding motility-associated ABC transporter substrate-binding protein GldG [Cytophagales bacterium]